MVGSMMAAAAAPAADLVVLDGIGEGRRRRRCRRRHFPDPDKGMH